MIKSRALEVNLARTQVEVVIDPAYNCLQEVLQGYYGLLDGLNTFLKEVSHPYKNWHYIINGARGYALDYFHLMRVHPKGGEAVDRLIGIFLEALTSTRNDAEKIDAADNLILFLQKIIRTAAGDFHRFVPTLNHTFKIMSEQPEDDFRFFMRSYYPIKRLADDLRHLHGPLLTDCTGINRLLLHCLQSAQTYWLGISDPLDWFCAEAGIQVSSELKQLFEQISHAALRDQRDAAALMAAQADLSDRGILERLLDFTYHNDIVRLYREIPQQLLDIGGCDTEGNNWKVIFLFHTMNIDGLSLIHEDTLRDINRTLKWLITHKSPRYVRDLITKTFSILASRANQYPATALTCLQNMGHNIYKTNNGELIDFFIDAVIRLDFQTPMIKGVGNDWQIQVNTAHLQNIRAWLALIKLGPKRSRRLLSNLIIHLAVSGVFIRDTDLFGRDITELLNCDIRTVYNLIKQLARLFPVYFNDIGAEGDLRDISTQIDEICHRRDPLIHFLRKQSHVEGSNRIIYFMDAALKFWMTRDKSELAPFLPPNIFEQVSPQGPLIDGVHMLVTHLSKEGLNLPQDLLYQDKSQLTALVSTVKEVKSVDRQRVVLFAELYKQLNNKYNLDAIHLNHYLSQLTVEAFPHLDQLKKALAETDLKKKIFDLLDFLERLKNIIMSPETFEIRENIYKKRHFTVDIPSMYGSYHEMKFDAMGLTLRLEAQVNVLLEELIDTIDLSLITKATCYQIYERLVLFDKALHIDGIASAELERQLDMLAHSLEVRGFSFTQYLDIYKGFAQAVRNIINDYFNNIHGGHLTRILAQLPPDQIHKKYHPASEDVDPEKLRHRASEIFLRERIAMSLGLRQLDLFLSRILNTLFHQSNKLPKDKLRRLLNYDPQRAITALYRPNHRVAGIIYLGNKGLNMLKLKNFGLPVPPAFIITTEVFRCREIIEAFQPAEDNFKEQVVARIKELEQLVGKQYGNLANPLLFSVRSGSSISQPGMMDTFLNVGMNERIAEGLAAQSGNTWFAWDSYRRFLQCYGMSLGLKRDDFDAIIGDFKGRHAIPLKKSFTGEQMKQIAMAYKKLIIDSGFQVQEDPLKQLYQTISIVMDSWESAKAKTYRQIMGISDDWGTAVTVQVMVFGNISQMAGSGVIFTHNPRWSGENLSLWGDFTLENQGEDVVAGLVRTLPISIKQQEIEMRDTDITLETHFPEIYQAMLAYAQDLVFKKGWSPQEMEFTFEGSGADQLYLLQTRDMAIRERKRVLTFDPLQKEACPCLGHGIGVSGGALSGRMVFNLEEVEFWREKEPETALILVRGDTVPDDIKEIFATDGLLTARGGVTSHAAVVAHRLGKTCVVGCGNMDCDEKNKTVAFAQRRLFSGGHISIDGREGSVYQGLLKIQET